MRRTALVFVLALVAVLVAAGGAASKTSKATFDVHVGDNFLPPLAQPSIARAASGETITIVLKGPFSAAGKSPSGSGTFGHRPGTTGLATGTLPLPRTIAFKFHGWGAGPAGSTVPRNP